MYSILRYVLATQDQKRVKLEYAVVVVIYTDIISTRNYLPDIRSCD